MERADSLHKIREEVVFIDQATPLIANFGVSMVPINYALIMLSFSAVIFEFTVSLFRDTEKG